MYRVHLASLIPVHMMAAHDGRQRQLTGCKPFISRGSEDSERDLLTVEIKAGI